MRVTCKSPVVAALDGVVSVVRGNDLPAVPAVETSRYSRVTPARAAPWPSKIVRYPVVWVPVAGLIVTVVPVRVKAVVPDTTRFPAVLDQTIRLIGATVAV